MQTTRTPTLFPLWRQCYFYCSLLAIAPLPTQLSHLVRRGVIYPANQKQVLLPVTNNDPASVYLIQSWIENAGDQKDTQFVITHRFFHAR